MAHGSITVSAPATGATWYKGTAYSIVWSATGAPASWTGFSIYLYDGTGLQDTVSTSVSGGSRSYLYTPATSLDTASDYHISITGTYTEEAP